MARKRIERSTSGEGNVIDMKTGKPVEKPVLPVICERIQHYRNLMGMEQKALADLIGITPNSISNWENGRSRPDVNLLPGICEALNISFYDLFDIPDPTVKFTARQQLLADSFTDLSEGHKQAVENLIDTLSRVEAAENCPDLTILTYFSRQLAAGFGDPTEFEDEGEEIYVYSSPDVNRADCIFTVNGNNMEPDFHSGQDVLVQRIPTGPDLRYGEIGAFIVGNETYIKVYREDGLYSLNPDYAIMHFYDSDSVYLIGRVLGILDKASYANETDIARYRAVHGVD